MRIERVRVRETNCYLLRGEQGTILVDPGPPGGAARVTRGVEAAGVRPEEIRLIFVTHGHIDHFGSAARVKAWCGAPVAAHRDEPAFSRKLRNALPPGQTLRGDAIRWGYLLLSPLVRYEPLEADVLLEEGADLSPFGIEGQVLHIPGHAPGSLGILTPERDVWVGDLFVNYTVPSRPMYISDRRAWHSSHARIRALKPRMVFVGHGEPFSGEQLEHIHAARYQFRWWVW